MNIMIPTWVNGTLTPVDKLEAHQRGLKHKAVSVFVLRDDQILIQRRALGKYHTPGLWANTCCTHPEWQEDSLTCAIRRLDEELGIKRLTPEFRHQAEYRADVGGGLIEHEVVDIFVADAPDDMMIAPNPDEVMDFAWVGYDALVENTKAQPSAYTPWLKIYLETYSAHIFPSELIAGQSAD